MATRKPYGQIKYLLRLLYLTAIVLWAPAAFPAPEKTFSIGSEFFRWQEFSSSGNRFLSEHGLRYRGTIAFNDVLPRHDKFSYHALLRGYIGSIDYDGQTQPGSIFVPSTADYAGWNGELGSRYEYSAVNHRSVSRSVFAALGIDHWIRDLQDSTDAQGNPVGGIREEYQILYGRLGLQFEHAGSLWQSGTRVGIKYPFTAKEKIDSLGIELEPGRQVTFFASYRGTIERRNGRTGYLEVGYDAYRFDASPVISGWQQPQSHQDVITISIGTTF